MLQGVNLPQPEGQRAGGCPTLQQRHERAVELDPLSWDATLSLPLKAATPSSKAHLQ